MKNCLITSIFQEAVDKTYCVSIKNNAGVTVAQESQPIFLENQMGEFCVWLKSIALEKASKYHQMLYIDKMQMNCVACHHLRGSQRDASGWCGSM